MANIKNPDSIGSKSQFTLRSLYLNGAKGRNGLVNFNQSYFYTPSVDFAYTYNCEFNYIEFEGRDTFGATSHSWTCHKIYGNSWRFSTIKSPNIQFLDTGVYEVIYVASKGGRSDTVIKQVTIYPMIRNNFLGKDTSYCTGDRHPVLLKTPTDLHCILWQDGSETETYTADTAGKYYVTVTNKGFCSVSDTIYVKEISGPLKPVLKQSGDSIVSSVEQSTLKYRWFRNDTFISSNKNYIIASKKGTYKLTVANAGCDSSSASISVNHLSDITFFNLSSFNIYPNPTDHLLTIEGGFEKSECKAILMDLTGRIIQSMTFTGKQTINITDQSPSLYILSISQNNAKHQFKITIE